MERKIINKLRTWKDCGLLGCMVEVKAEENVRARSMSEYIKSHPQYNLKGLRISMLGYEDQDWMENIPLFGMAKYFSESSEQTDR